MTDATSEEYTPAQIEGAFLQCVRKGWISTLDRKKYSEVYAELQRVTERNGLDMPRLFVYGNEMLEMNEVFRRFPIFQIPSVKGIIFLHEKIPENIVAIGSTQKNFAHMLIHDIAHSVTTPVGTLPNKKNEYITDRTAAAMIGDEEAYREAIEVIQKWSEMSIEAGKKQKMASIAADDNIPENAKKAAKLEAEKFFTALKESGIEVYGTTEERLANIQYDIDRSNKKGREL